MRHSWFLLLVVSLAACNGEALEIPLTGQQVDMRRDFSSSTGIDHGVGGDPGFSCLDIIDCTNSCETQSCVNKCLMKGSSMGKAAYLALSDCIDQACPAVPASDAGMNSPCAYNPSTGKLLNENACNTCVENAQQGDGVCGSEINACFGEQMN